MSIYGNGFIANKNETLTIEESKIFVESIIYEAFDNDSLEEQYIQEGVNEDYTKSFQEGKKKYKEAVKSFKKAIKDKDNDKAKKEIKVMKEVCKDIEKSFKEISKDDSVGSNIIGLLLRGILEMQQLLIPAAIRYGGGVISGGAALSMFKNIMTGNESGLSAKFLISVFGVSASLAAAIFSFIKAIILLIKDIVKLIDQLKEEDKKVNALNLYKNNLLMYVDKMKKNIDKLEKLVN